MVSNAQQQVSATQLHRRPNWQPLPDARFFSQRRQQHANTSLQGAPVQAFGCAKTVDPCSGANDWDRSPIAESNKASAPGYPRMCLEVAHRLAFASARIVCSPILVVYVVVGAMFWLAAAVHRPTKIDRPHRDRADPVNASEAKAWIAEMESFDRF